MTDLEAYYNKFNEEKRLDSRHGRVEFVTSMHYIHQCLDEIVKERAKEEIHILDIGAGTGRYSVPLAQEGTPETEGCRSACISGKCNESEKIFR